MRRSVCASQDTVASDWINESSAVFSLQNHSFDAKLGLLELKEVCLAAAGRTSPFNSTLMKKQKASVGA